MDLWALGSLLLMTIIMAVNSSTQLDTKPTQEEIEDALEIIEAVSSEDGCEKGEGGGGGRFRLIPTPVQATRYDTVRQKADMAAFILQDIDLNRHQGVVEGVAKSLLISEGGLLTTRVVSVNGSSGEVAWAKVWKRGRAGGAEWEDEGALPSGAQPPPGAPWYPRGPAPQHYMPAPDTLAYRGWWTYPYYTCKPSAWVLSYTVPIPPSPLHEMKVFLSFDIDISHLEINQCEATHQNEIKAFAGTHKCHNTTRCVYQKDKGRGWTRGGYACKCKDGYYMPHSGLTHFSGATLEAAWHENNSSREFESRYRCEECAPGCSTCNSPAPCLATYNWPFRSVLLFISAGCVFLSLCLVAYVYHHRRLKVFKVASPIFLSITLLGCAIMYAEMAAIFPILDLYSCIATKWSRHLGFCITYTALLMKTWRVSLTYRVKSAHKVKLTDKQLLQWMFPILLVMLIYLGTWTVSDPPVAERIKDSNGLIFKQCSFNWWDHSLAIGEVLFLGWGVRVCYNVRNAESLFNEARLISYAIYNIAVVNIAMVAFHVFLFPSAGPDIKYLLGFIRTQMSTTVTVALVFGPKVFRVLRGQGDQWDTQARARAVTASFSLNGIGLVKEETADLYQENEELKEEIQKLAGQIEFMKIVSMEMNNRHLKPKAGGYFSSNPATSPGGGGAGGGALRLGSTRLHEAPDLSERV